jgi:hypothetical protein
MEGFYKTYLDLFKTIEDSITKERIVPALILLYTGIDSFSWLVNNDETKKDCDIFKSWVDTWMFSKNDLPCNSEELYAARNGLLHRQSSQSRNTEKKTGVRQILYAYGSRTQGKLQEVVVIANFETKYVAVQLEYLLSSFKSGMNDCLSDIQKDKFLMQKFEKKAKQLFVNITDNDLQNNT